MLKNITITGLSLITINFIPSTAFSLIGEPKGEIANPISLPAEDTIPGAVQCRRPLALPCDDYLEGILGQPAAQAILDNATDVNRDGKVVVCFNSGATVEISGSSEVLNIPRNNFILTSSPGSRGRIVKNQGYSPALQIQGRSNVALSNITMDVLNKAIAVEDSSVNHIQDISIASVGGRYEAFSINSRMGSTMVRCLENISIQSHHSNVFRAGIEIVRYDGAGTATIGMMKNIAVQFIGPGTSIWASDSQIGSMENITASGSQNGLLLDATIGTMRNIASTVYHTYGHAMTVATVGSIDGLQLSSPWFGLEIGGNVGTIRNFDITIPGGYYGAGVMVHENGILTLLENGVIAIRDSDNWIVNEGSIGSINNVFFERP